MIPLGLGAGAYHRLRHPRCKRLAGGELVGRLIENKANRRPDIVVFINGLPLGVIELKNPADENATIDGAFNQLQTYKAQIPSLFHTNAALVISDDLSARVGSLTADRERFMPWRSILGQGRVIGARGGGNGRRALRRPRHDAQRHRRKVSGHQPSQESQCQPA